MGNSVDEPLHQQGRFEIGSVPNRSIRCADPASLISAVVPGADRYIKITDSLCPDCVAAEEDDVIVPMVVYEAAGEIRLAKECSEHGIIRDVY